MRRGLFSAVSSYRQADEFVITEDINIPVERLAEGCAAFQELFARHGYQAGIMGHAFHGNFHFTLPTRISDPAELDGCTALDDLAVVITRGSTALSRPSTERAGPSRPMCVWNGEVLD